MSFTYEKTRVQCLFKRVGPDGYSYYGRAKRHGRGYIKKLSIDYEKAKEELRKWLNGLDKMAVAAALEGETSAYWSDFKDKYLEETAYDVGLAERSKQYRNECVARIEKTWSVVFGGDINDRMVSTITTSECQKWAASIVGFHRTTYNNTLATFKRLLQDATDAGALLVNPAAKLKRMGKRQQRLLGNVIGEPGELLTKTEQKDLKNAPPEEARWYPTPAQFAAIIKQMRVIKFGPVRKASEFAELLAYTGMRLSEAGRFRWKDVDYAKNRIRVDGSKGRMAGDASSVRHVPINSALADLLKRLERISPNRKPGDFVARAFECRGTMQRACRELELPRQLDHHDLRHWFATQAIAAGVPIPVVSDWLGHKDGGALLLSTYRHEDETVSQNWVKKLALKPTK